MRKLIIHYIYMSVKSELLMNTQNSFQTHAQRGANIVMRGGGSLESALRNKIEAAEKKINEFDNYFKDGCSCKYYVKNDEYKKDLKKRDALVGDLESLQSEAYMRFPDKFNKPSKIQGGKRKSKRTKRMARKSRRKQRGGGRTITFSTLDHMANSRLGKMVPHGDVYTNCNKQSGGGFGFTREGAADAATFKGSYPAFQKYEKSKQCGGRKRRRRKSRKSRRKRRKSRKKSRKSRRKRRKSRRRRRRRRGGRPPVCGPGETPRQDGCRVEMIGGSSASYAAPFAGGEKPWATAPLGIQKNGASCYDNYNHYKGL